MPAEEKLHVSYNSLQDVTIRIPAECCQLYKAQLSSFQEIRIPKTLAVKLRDELNGCINAMG